MNVKNNKIENFKKVFLSKEYYSTEVHEEIVNSLIAFRELFDDKAFNEFLCKKLTEIESNSESIFFDKEVYEAILLDYFKSSIEHNEISEDEMKNIDILLYKKYKLLNDDSNTLLSINSYRKDLYFNFEKILDNELKVCVNNAFEQGRENNIKDIVLAYISNDFEKNKYNINIRLNVKGILLTVTTYDKEFDEEKKLMESLLLAIDYISSNLLKDKNLQINMKQLEPSIRALNLTRNIEVDNLKEKSRKKI